MLVPECWYGGDGGGSAVVGRDCGWLGGELLSVILTVSGQMSFDLKEIAAEVAVGPRRMTWPKCLSTISPGMAGFAGMTALKGESNLT